MNDGRGATAAEFPPPQDHSLFESFVVEHRSNLVGALRLRTGDRMLAEEIAQEAFARAWLKWTDVRMMVTPAGWLYRVAFNLATSHWRRGFALKRALRKIEPRPTGPEPLPSEAAQALQDAISQLSARQSEVIILRYLVGLTVDETAEALGLRQGTVKSHSSRAMDKLRSLLDTSDGSWS